MNHLCEKCHKNYDEDLWCKNCKLVENNSENLQNGENIMQAVATYTRDLKYEAIDAIIIKNSSALWRFFMMRKMTKPIAKLFTKFEIFEYPEKTLVIKNGKKLFTYEK